MEETTSILLTFHKVKQHSFHFARALLAVVSSQLHALSSTLWSDYKPSSNFCTISCWLHSQMADMARRH